MSITVSIPVALQQFTGIDSKVDVDASTVEETLTKLDELFPGLRAFLVDESNRLRRYVNIFVNVDTKQFAVYATQNAGRTWKKLSKGLPTKNAFLGCYREGLTTDQPDPVGLYVSTRMGHLFSSVNEGKSWELAAQWLPPIYSVSTANPAS